MILNQGSEIAKQQAQMYLLSESKHFKAFLQSLLLKINNHEHFLNCLQQHIDKKNIYQTFQISCLARTVSLFLRKIHMKNQIQEKEIIDLMQRNDQWIILGSLMVQEKEIKHQYLGHISLIWDKIMHYSCYKNILQVLILYEHCKWYLFEKQIQFSRLVNLLIQSVVKIKIINDNSLEQIISITSSFIKFLPVKKNIEEIKSKLSIINLLFQLKRPSFPSEKQLKTIQENLITIRSNHLQNLINYQQKQQSMIPLQQQIIWDYLFSSLLKIYVRFETCKQTIKILLQEMIIEKLDLQAVKLLVKQLQITNESNPLNKWIEIFNLIIYTLKIYPKPIECLSFSVKSFYKHTLPYNNQFYAELQIRLCRSQMNQKIILMVQDKSRSKQLWLSVRYESQKEIMLILLSIQNKIIYEKRQQRLIYHQQFTTKVGIEFNKTKHIFSIMQYSQDQLKNNVTLQFDKRIDNPFALVVGDQDGIFGNATKYLYDLTIYQNKNLQGGICHRLLLDPKNQHKGLIKKCLPSFVDLIKAVGDLDIFLMIISHAIKKLKKHPQIVLMIREAIRILQNLVIVKNMHKVKLSPAEKEKRLNAILCLCWQCCSQTCSAEAILQLLRVLGIRGVSNPEDELQILCNFVFWKHFQWQYQKIIIMKIKELFSQIRHKDNYTKYIYKYSKRILQETALYYREEQFILSTPEIRDNILKVRYEFIDLVKQQLVYNQQHQLYFEFFQFCTKLLSWTLSRRNTSIDAFDITYAIQLSFLIAKMKLQGKRSGQNQDYLLKLLKCIFDVISIYDEEEKFFENKKLKVYQGQAGYQFYEDKVIKDNLNQTAMKIVCIDNTILFWFVGHQKANYSEIYQLIWISYISQILKMNHISVTAQKRQEIIDLIQVFPFSFLNFALIKQFLTFYINDSFIFKKSHKIVNRYFGQNLSIEILKDFWLQICKTSKEVQSQLTIQTKQSDFSDGDNSQWIKIEKFLDIMTYYSNQNSYEQQIQLLDKIFHRYSHYQYLNIFIQHINLSAFLYNIRQLGTQSSTQSMFLQSLTAIPSPIETTLSQPFNYLSREKILQTLQHYFTTLSKKTLQSFLNLKGQGEIEKSFDHYRGQVQKMINYLSSCQTNNIYKLKNFEEFLDKKLLSLSRYCLQQHRKNHIQSISNKKPLNFKFPSFCFVEEAKNMYNSFLDQRNFNLFKVQKVWSEVEQKNKYFWSTFIGKEIYYKLYEGTGPFNHKYLLKRDTKKPKLELPRMQRASCFRSGSMSIVSEKFDMSLSESDASSSSIFDMAHLYKKQVTNYQNITNWEQPLKQITKHKKIKVLLVTSHKIYQGLVSIINKKLLFKQNQNIDPDLYGKVFAAESQQRGDDQCIKENYICEQDLSNRCQAIVKRYLFHDLAVELHTINRSYFFSFFKKQHRQTFLHMLEGIVDILSHQRSIQEAKNLSQCWESGLLTNFQYLMRLNDLSGRTYNDLSQYYIFPWTVVNFQDEFSLEFFKNRQNFRDLSLPIGKIDKKKWSQLKKRYENKKQNSFQEKIPQFLYGSFYSNRAIVCNYLIRIYPFSSQHFELQSNRFDLADRLFFSIPDSYKSLRSCFSDVKELVPQFYYFPEFLKNRNSYNLGSRQNKDIVNNVTLPKWALDEYEFIFKMNKILESQMVTKGLHSWIDLIFGVYASRQHAIKADNLFEEHLYFEGYVKYQLQNDKTALAFFKQFGQVPIPLFTKNHNPSKIQTNYLDQITNSSVQIQQFVPYKIQESGKVLQIFFHKRFTFILLQKQLRMYEDEKYGQKSFVFINGQFDNSSINFWEMFDSNCKKHYFILLHKKKNCQLIAYEIKKNLFNNYTIDTGQIFPFKHKCELYTTLGSYFFCSENKNIYIYKNVQEIMEEDYSNLNYSLILNISKHKYLLSIFTQFSQHKSKIIHLNSNHRNFVVTLDKENRVFIIQIPETKLSIFNFFDIKNLFFQQSVMQLIIHNMGYLIFRTNYDRILMYSFLGDKIIEQYMNFEKIKEKLQRSTNISIWNHQLSEIIVTTNLGNLWKIDLYQLKKAQKITPTPLWIEKIYLNKEGIRKEGLLNVVVRRVGRQFFVVVLGQNNKIYSLRSDGWPSARGELSKKVWD